MDGIEYVKCLSQEPRTYRSASGPVSVPRNLYRPKGSGKCICPIELRAGIVGRFFTPVGERWDLVLRKIKTMFEDRQHQD